MRDPEPDYFWLLVSLIAVAIVAAVLLGRGLT
jgi:hypothetical protein